MRGRRGRVRHAMGFNRPTEEQQTQDQAEHPLFLVRHRIHSSNLAGWKLSRNFRFRGQRRLCDFLQTELDVGDWFVGTQASQGARRVQLNSVGITRMYSRDVRHPRRDRAGWRCFARRNFNGCVWPRDGLF